MKDKLIPYSVYLQKEYYDKIKDLAKERKASSMIRDAICMVVDGGDQFVSGYNQAIRDCVSLVKNMNDINILAIKGKYVDDIITTQLEQLSK